MSVFSYNSHDNNNNHNNPHFVWSTWNESRNVEFPQVLEYRAHWEQYGFQVQITPNENIRKDVEKLVEETGQDHLLAVFDSLGTTNMQYDFWRYCKLYLEGGIYADVDVDPLGKMSVWQQEAEDHDAVVIFEESPSFYNHSLFKLVRPLISNCQDFPSFASCVVIAPRARAPFFLDLLNDVDPEKWIHVKEPKRTLMTIGPGHLTQFAKTRHEKDVIRATRKDGSLAYQHNGFGTWKSSKTLAFEKYGSSVYILSNVLLLVLIKFVYTRRGRRAGTGTKDAEKEKVVLLQDEESSHTSIMDSSDEESAASPRISTSGSQLYRRSSP